MIHLVICLSLLNVLNSGGTNALEFKASDTCIEISNKFRDQYINEIKQDLINSFNLDVSNYSEYNSHDDTQKLYQDLDSSDKRTSSLTDMFVGEYYGVKFVYINKNQTEGYIVFKDKNGNNRMEKVIKTEKRWIKVDTRVVKSVPPYEFDYRGFFCL
ncbi:hypothetical protein LG311_14195 [Sutcliffiella horikoshii]|uniref:hypothetical protein n=1 Tax=Sutcliffiella horikoshii TaxID=79883 RepID=UPI0038510A4F